MEAKNSKQKLDSFKSFITIKLNNVISNICEMKKELDKDFLYYYKLNEELLFDSYYEEKYKLILELIDGELKTAKNKKINYSSAFDKIKNELLGDLKITHKDVMESNCVISSSLINNHKEVIHERFLKMWYKDLVLILKSYFDSETL